MKNRNMLSLNWLLVIVAGLYIAIFIKNAWVSDDAYIIFRTIDQLYHGNGLIWNPHARVQVFTSPLWFMIVAIGGFFYQNLYIVVLLLSFMLCIGLFIVLRKIFQDIRQYVIIILMLIVCNGFFDFTSSGLENPLIYFLSALYLYYYLKFFECRNPKYGAYLSIIFGIMMLTRHDLVTLFLLPSGYIWYQMHQVDKSKNVLKYIIVSIVPIGTWSVFSLIYYGMLFPNTAYAKLNTGIDKWVLVNQGTNYIFYSFQYDTIMILVVLFSIMFLAAVRKNALSILGLGIFLNLVYIIYIGGDFMQGRFLAYLYLTAAIVFTLNIKTQTIQAGIILSLLIYMGFYPHTPVNSPFDYKNESQKHNISDERGFYFEVSSLWAYLQHPGDDCFIDISEGIDPERFRRIAEQPVQVAGGIGYWGYCIGKTDKIIVDYFALADPLLARLPVSTTLPWRVGHYVRDIPEGYLQSLSQRQNKIKDSNISAYYDKIRLITESDDLFAYERLKTIFRLNTGGYEYYLLNTHYK